MSGKKGKARSPREIRAMIATLERSGFDVARDMAKVLDWALGNEPSPLLKFYIEEGDKDA